MSATTRPLAEPPADLSGRLLDDRYRLIEPLKRGAMGTVYLAEQIRLGTRVAVKLLHEMQEERTRERFAREAAALAQLQHPNVARGIDFGWTKNGRLFLVMEYIQGRDLRERLASEGALPWREACRLGSQIAAALHEAHEAGLVHRDLKPENVMLEKGAQREDVRILDFGIAHVMPDALGGDQRPLTLAGDVIGTVGYMAPEQAMGQRVDRRADLYALGVLIWEMLSGERLFGEDPEGVLGTQLRQAAPRPVLERGAPDELGDLVSQLLETLPAERPSNADGVAKKLGGFLEEKAPRRPWLGLALVAAAVLGAVGLWQSKPQPVIPTEQPVAPSIAEVVDPVDLPVKEEEQEEQEPFPLDDLLEGERSQRVAAAHAVLSRIDEAPPFSVAVARLELARQCETKERQLRALIRYEDSRALPAVRRANRLPDDGCGLLNRRDCFACLRDTVTNALRELRAP